MPSVVSDGRLTTTGSITTSGGDIVHAGSKVKKYRYSILGCTNAGVARQPQLNIIPMQDLRPLVEAGVQSANVRETYLDLLPTTEYPEHEIAQLLSFHGGMSGYLNGIAVIPVHSTIVRQNTNRVLQFSRVTGDEPALALVQQLLAHAPNKLQEQSWVLANILARFMPNVTFQVAFTMDTCGRDIAETPRIVNNPPGAESNYTILELKANRLRADLASMSTKDALHDARAEKLLAWDLFNRYLIQMQGTVVVIQPQDLRIHQLVDALEGCIGLADIDISLQYNNPITFTQLDIFERCVRTIGYARQMLDKESIKWMPMVGRYFSEAASGKYNISSVPLFLRTDYEIRTNAINLGQGTADMFAPSLLSQDFLDPRVAWDENQLAMQSQNFYKTVRPTESLVLKYTRQIEIPYADWIAQTADVRSVADELRGVIQPDLYVPKNFQYPRVPLNQCVVGTVTQLLRRWIPNMANVTVIPLKGGALKDGGAIQGLEPSTGWTLKVKSSDKITASADACFPFTQDIQTDLMGSMEIPYPSATMSTGWMAR